MKRLYGYRTLAILLFQLIAVEMLSAAPPDPTLLALVPPGTQIVAGINKRMGPDEPEGFLLLNQKNVDDRRDFISLAGVDDSMIVRQMIFAAGGGDESKLGEHSLLMSGHFNQARIFKAAVENGARISEFKGLQVLVQQPFERDVGMFKDTRWLAVIDSNLALFGTSFSVQQELDRHSAGSGVDPALMQKLGRLCRDDATWSVVEMAKLTDAIEHALASLDPGLVNLVHNGDSFEFGVRYRRKVEVEYEITVASSASAQAVSNSSTQSLAGGTSRGFAVSPRLGPTGERASVHGVVKVAKNHYAEWLSGFSQSSVH